MELNRYQELALETAVYPGKDDIQGLTYATLGLAGEAGEIANKVKKILRDDGGVLQDGKLIGAELGDVLWYVAAVADELGVDLDTIATANLAKLANRAERNVLSGSGDER